VGTYAIKLPDIGEGTAEAELVEWSVKVGDEVAEDEIVAAVMTDKATIEIPSSSAGKVVWLGAAVGDKIAVGSDLLRLEVRGPTGDQDVAIAAASTAMSATQVTESILRPDDASLPAEHPGPRLRPLAAPVVRRTAREAGIDLKTVKGSGPAGRILRSDLAAVMERPQAKPRPERPTEEVKIAGLRRIISERMAASVHQAAHFSYVEEVEVDKLEDLRAALNARNGDAGPRLTLLPFLLKAISVAIDEFPQMNAHFHADRGVVARHGAFHAGIATQTPEGLMVPVLRNAERMNLYEMANEIARLAAAARQGTAKRDELTGSTLTITSLGTLGGLVTTPVLNLPEVAIVGVNKISVRPVWDGARFQPVQMMNLSSSFDHRVIDGHDAASFVQRIKSLLEEPATMFIGSPH
jgi:2-oxoisovalerate dehydrogenase E2 component (dihydrolipoyl transacylase)